MRLHKIRGIWRKLKGKRQPDRPEPPLHPQTPPRDPQIYPHTPISPLTYPRHCQRQPYTLTNVPDTQQTSSDTLISPSVLPDIP